MINYSRYSPPKREREGIPQTQLHKTEMINGEVVMSRYTFINDIISDGKIIRGEFPSVNYAGRVKKIYDSTLIGSSDCDINIGDRCVRGFNR